MPTARVSRVSFLTIGILTGLFCSTVFATQQLETQQLIAEHRQAAAEAQKKVAFHEGMEKNFVTGKGGPKMDMVGHCRYWADYYRKLADQEEQAAKELEQKGP